jgi:hypothetical protein
MTTNGGEKQEKCSICGKNLNYWTTPFKKYKGKKVCMSCAWKGVKEETAQVREKQKVVDKTGQDIDNFGNRLIKIGKKLILGLTFPIILFFIGLFTFPIGILFWILGIVLFVNLFAREKGK